MKILVLGGTQFVGRHIVEALIGNGHAVTTLTRGHTPDALPAAVERLRGDRDAGAAGLGALADRRWDACIDLSGYTPRQVQASAERLRERVRRYVYVSAVSVYGDPAERPVRETCERLPPAAHDVTEVSGETYGALKVACEDIVDALYGDRACLLRPQIVVGPHDWIGRYAYWVQRAMHGSPMLAPGDGSDHVQVIDARDLARFATTAIENDLDGAFNLAGPRLTWSEFIAILDPPEVVWAPAAILAAAGLDFVELPLFRPEHGPRSSLMDVSNERARASGLSLTAPEVTVADVRTSLSATAPAPGLSREREAALIALARR